MYPMNQPIPVAKNKLNVRQQKKARRDAFYKLGIDMNKSAKSYVKDLDSGQLESILEAYATMMKTDPEKEEKTVEVDINIMRQMSLFAICTLSRILVERYK